MADSIIQFPGINLIKKAAAVTVLLAVCCGSIVYCDSAAAEPERGRLPDGRAFRTDAEGNQLVDYIAELELSVEALTRQVRGLEDENRDKQAIIGRLQSGREANPAVIEKDIQPALLPPKAESQRAGAECKCPAAPPGDGGCSAKIEEYARQLDDAKIDIGILKKKHKAEIEGYNFELLKAREALESSGRELELSRVRAADSGKKTDESTAAASVPGSRPSEAAPVHPVRPEPSPSPVPAEVAVKTDFTPNTLGQARSQAVEVLSRKMIADLGSLEGLIASRNALLKQARPMGSLPERFNAEPEEQKELSILRGKIREATKVQELSEIRIKVNEIRGRVQSDIAQLRRIVRR